MRLLPIALMVLILGSCNAQTKDLTDSLDVRVITLDGLQKDSIVALLTAQRDTLNIFREIEVIENQNTDTLLLGYSIIHPGYTGKIWFIQSGLDRAGGVYLDKSQPLDPSDPVSFAKLFTIGVLKQRYENGFKKIVIKLQVKPSVDDSSQRR
jgi:hypothetical protein